MLALSGIILRNGVRRLYHTGSLRSMHACKDRFLFFLLGCSRKYGCAGGMIQPYGMQGPSGAARLIICSVKADQLFCVYICALHIQRDIQPGRTRTSGVGQINSLFQTVADPQRVNDHLAVLCHAVNGFHNIKFLVTHSADAHAGPAGRGVVTDLTG